MLCLTTVSTTWIIAGSGRTRRHCTLRPSRCHASCSSRQIASAGGCEDGSRPILDAELAKDPADVELDSAFKQLELASNFLVGFSFSQHHGNFALARRKATVCRQHPRPNTVACRQHHLR